MLGYHQLGYPSNPFDGSLTTGTDTFIIPLNYNQSATYTIRVYKGNDCNCYVDYPITFTNTSTIETWVADGYPVCNNGVLEQKQINACNQTQDIILGQC